MREDPEEMDKIEETEEMEETEEEVVVVMEETEEEKVVVVVKSFHLQETRCRWRDEEDTRFGDFQQRPLRWCFASILQE